MPLNKILKATIIITLMVWHLPASAQVNKRAIDSLQHILKTKDIHDTMRILIMSNCARMLRHQYPDSAMNMVREADRIVDDPALKTHRPTVWKARLNASRSMIFSKLNRYDSAIHYGEKAAPVFKEQKLYKEYHTIMNILAELYISTGNYARSIDLFHQVIQTASSVQDYDNLGSAYGNIGSIYSNFGMYEKAVEQNKLALGVFEKIGDSILMGAALANMGLAYNDLGNGPEALRQLNRSLKIFENLKRHDVLPNVKTALAKSLTMNGKLDEAVALIDDALSSAIKEGNEYKMANAYIVSATASRNKAEKTGDPQLVSRAMQHAREGLVLSRKIGEVQLETKALKELYTLYKASRQFEPALQYQEQYRQLYDSISGENRRQEIAIKETEFVNESEKQLLEERHRASMLRQRNIRSGILVIGGIVLLAGVLLFLLYRKLQKAKVAQLSSELRTEIADLELKALRAQMNPHFIFNCLTSISQFITQNKPAEARDYLTRFARLMRMILEHSDQKQISLEQELDALRMYIELESLRFVHKPVYTISVDPEINTEETFIPSLVLQPFVENAFKHAFGHSVEKRGELNIHIRRDGDQIICTITDNGQPLKMESRTIHREQPSFGLALTKKRLERTAGVNKTPVKLDVNHSENGTRVELVFQGW